MLVVGVAVLLVGTQPATASPTSVTVSAGTLHVTSPAMNDFAVVLLSGTAQATAAPLEPFSVTDARGSGGGWTLTLQATPFREWDGTAYVPDGKALPLGSLSLGGLSVTADGTDSDAPNVIAGPYVLDGQAVTVASASVGTGMGAFVFTPTGALRVTVPANAYARSYRSELSLSVTSGP